MARLSLNPAPTFKAKVGIPVPGADPAPVECTFKYRTRTELTAWLKDSDPKQADPDLLMDLLLGWDLDDTFNAENVARLCDAYPGAGLAIYGAYLTELRGVRAKN